MQIVIPMSGFGERFRRVGYTLPKPLIEIEGKPIIQHVVEMFPGEVDFKFIVNQDHLNHPDYGMEEKLKRICPTGQILSIPAHKKGPIFAVQQVADHIDLGQPVIVNYCDFTCFWDYPDFKKQVEDVDGSIPAYRGFHPHSLGKTNYAYMQENNGRVLDIQEKQPYTDNRMQEYASSGTYYFSSGKLMLDAFEYVVEHDLNVSGEYYVSLAYKPLFEWNKHVSVYPLKHFMQWGTPEDVDEYNYWSNSFRKLSVPSPKVENQQGVTILPMAGLGNRFKEEGYKTPKPLIEVSGKPMVIQAVDDLPKTAQYCFVMRQEMPEEIEFKIKASFPNAIIEKVPQVTDGQARTAAIGLKALQDSLPPSALGEMPITFGVCDSGILYNAEQYQSLVQAGNWDLIVWTVRGYPNAARYPEAYGWVKGEGDLVQQVSVKKPLDNPKEDPVITGIFTFKNAEVFNHVFQTLVDKKIRVNGEYYLDSCVQVAKDLGYQPKIFDVDSFLCWGTPNDLKTFEYWQACFHLWFGHPYSVYEDKRVEDPERLVQKIEYWES